MGKREIENKMTVERVRIVRRKERYSRIKRWTRQRGV